jgi:hypothetical protein
LPSFYWHLSQQFLFKLSKIAMKKERVKGERPAPVNAALALSPAKGALAKADRGKREGRDSADLVGLADRWDQWVVK